VFRFFERLVNPYPEAVPATPPRGFVAFLWAGSKGVRG
jgi:ATP-binding cassette subfamily B multidrug efflux pump